MNSYKSKGFTLLELLIVVLIIALVLAVSYPALSRGSTALHLRTTARDVLNTFRYAREKSVTEQTAMRITVDREKQKLILTNDLGENGREYFFPHDVRMQRIALAGKVTDEGSVVIRFLPNGSSDNAEILIRSETGSSFRIIADPITGGARIEPGSGESSP
jgi:general secretion pathway protein H